MATQNEVNEAPVYQTITGGRIALSNLTDAEHAFLEKVGQKYNSRQDWTRFAAWWNVQFNASGLGMSSVVYRICQDLEARLGINQGKVAPPDYRDILIELIDGHFRSRQEFCKATEIDPGQLSRVLANRGDLSIKVLLKVLEVLRARLVIQTEEESRARTSVDQASQAIVTALALRRNQSDPPREIVLSNCSLSSNTEDEDRKTSADWVSLFPNVGNLQQVAERARAIARQQMPLMMSSLANAA